MLNIDTAATAFLEEQPLVQYLMRSIGVFNEQGLINMNQITYKKAAKSVNGIKVCIDAATSHVHLPVPAMIGTDANAAHS